MLDGLRNFARTWPGKILGLFVLIGLAGFGISGVLTGSSFNTIAKVGKERITTVQFQRSYSSQLNQYSERVGSVPTAEQAISLGIPSSVINQLASEASLNAMAKEFGIGVSDKRLGETVKEDPSFGTTLGTFNPETFRSVLARSGWTEKEYFETQRKIAQRQQIIVALFDGVKAPKTAFELVSRYGGDKRDIEYFVVSGENMLPPATPTQAEIKEYLTNNQSVYRTQTLREVDLMVLSPALIANNISVSDQEIRDEYERTKTNYTRIESRDILQVTLNSEILEKRFELGLETGENFVEIVSQTVGEASDLGFLTKAKILDSVLAEAAFGLKKGEFTIISGFDGKRAIYVSDIVEGGQTPFEEIKDNIAQRLKEKQAKTMFIDMLDNIEEQRAAFKPLKDIASQFKLEIIRTKVALNGNGINDSSTINDENSKTRVASAIFNANEGSLAPSIALGANMNVWFDIIKLEPARDQTINEVEQDIKEIMIKERTTNALANQVNEVVASLKNGADFASTAISSQFALAQVNDLTRSSSSNILSNAVVAKIFSGDKNLIDSQINENGDYVVFKVLNITPANEINEEAVSEAAGEFINGAFVDSIYSEFASSLLQEAGLKINQETLSQILLPPTQGGYN